jgi:hypothetical protein
MTRPLHLAAAVLLAVVLLATTACSGGDDDDAPSFEELLIPGACFNLTPEGNLSEDPESIVDCATPHDGEVFGTVEIPDAPEGAAYPGGDQLREFATPQCQTLVTEYTGLALIQLDLTFLRLVPTEATWADGDRSIICAASANDVQLEGSIKAGAAEGASVPTVLVDLPEPALGECYIEVVPGVIAGATIVPCTEAHQGEVYDVVGAGAPGDPFPGDEALAALASTECGAALGEFLGGATPPEIRAISYNPTETTWASGDTDIECAVVPVDAPAINGSAAGQGI